MIQQGFPFSTKGVSKAVKPEHLVPRIPRSSWDGWFAIAIFPLDSPVRWLKAHLFHGACGPGKHPLAAVEGFGAKSEMLITWATTGGVEVHRREVEAETIRSSLSPLRVELEGRFLLEGNGPQDLMAFSLPEDQVEARFTFKAGWPIWWSRFGRLLCYVGRQSAVRVDLVSGGAERAIEGFGVLEHAWGISLPFDFTRALPFHFHWDVLAFHTPGSPFDSAAGLSIGMRGKSLIPLRAAARLPGRSPEAARGLSVRYLEVSRGKTSKGEEIMVPVRWEGVIRGREGEFRYTAASTTPVAGIIPGGGMLGFDFGGELKSSLPKVESWKGTGFTEYGDFSSKLVNLAR